MYKTDTIAALATGAGPGAIAIIRVSGPNAQDISSRILVAKRDPREWQSHHLYRATVVTRDNDIDQVLAVLMRAPQSYTGEDVLEIHCHGNSVLTAQILDELCHLGARIANPGEFTKRAVLNGQMELTQAEAVMTLINAKSCRLAEIALQQLTGTLADSLSQLRSTLIRLKALLEAQIDFPEEDIEIDNTTMLDLIEIAKAKLEKLLTSYQHGAVARDGIRVAIVGKPNVGKSSLLNALLGRRRAIVSHIAGTTRDWIEERTEFCGIPVVLTDTAGIRPKDEADPVEQIGMERSQHALESAQRVLFVLDSSVPLDDLDHEAWTHVRDLSTLIVVNKIDLPRQLDSAEIVKKFRCSKLIEISAAQGDGIDYLRQYVIENLQLPKIEEDSPMIVNERHRLGLSRVFEIIDCLQSSLDRGMAADLVAVEVQAAIESLGEVTGEITNEEILDSVFNEFCIGK